MPSPASLLTLSLLLAGPSASLQPEALWKAWPDVRFLSTPAPCLRHAELVEGIRVLEARHAGGLSVEEVGRSVEGRPIHLLAVGHGPRRVLLWSQMHGDEPSATPALLDMADYLLSSPDPGAAALLDGATLLLLPMLNPDGAERYARRNAQGIDINRDARHLATPEGRLLKELRDRFEPELGFNLHDQNRRTTVGDTGRLATVALLAVAGDEEGTMTPGRDRARRVCAAIARSVRSFVPDGIARYDEDWNPRAFGDSITGWGTPVVLLESGGLPPGWGYPELTRLNFVALLSALSGLVEDDLVAEDPMGYEALERNQGSQWVDVLVSGGEVWQPGAGAPYRADVAFDRLDPDPYLAACEAGNAAGSSRVREIGDGELLGAARRVDAASRLVVPAFTASIRGLAVRDWLDDQALVALGRLGVASLRWRVAPGDRADAIAVARALEGPARPVIRVTEDGSGPCFLEVTTRPPTPESTDIGSVLDALTQKRWRSSAAGRTVGDLLGPLSTCPVSSPVAPTLAPDRAASFLLLRPASVRGAEPASIVRTTGRSPEAEELHLETVFVDGREPR